MYILVFYVPVDSAQKVKEALFNAGAGKFRNYDNCSWQTPGTGQFRALPGSNPHIGTLMKTESVDEYRVEMICSKERIREALQALLENHPYEEPAYHVLEDISDKFKISQ